MENKLSHFDIADYLDDEEVIVEFINEAINDAQETGDYSIFLSALGDVAKAKGITKIAQDAGIGRESLYKVFAKNAKPRYETIDKVLHALGLKITLTSS